MKRLFAPAIATLVLSALMSLAPALASLAVIATVLTVAIVASLRVQCRGAAGHGQQPVHKEQPAISS